MALWHVWQALHLWLVFSPCATVDFVGKKLGLSVSSSGPLNSTFHCRLKHEVGLIGLPAAIANADAWIS